MRLNPDFNQISHDVVDMFGADNIAMSFVTGSTVTAHATDTSDVDIFICHHDEPSAQRRLEFSNYYFNMHDELGRIPDTISPGEVMSLNQLHEGLVSVGNINPNTTVEAQGDFDSICWAGMLTSKKELLTPRTDELVQYEYFAKQVIAKWIKGVFGNIDVTIGTGDMTDSDKMLARKLSCPGYYDAHE